MKKYPLGEFEEIVLLTVGLLQDKGYGYAIKEEIETRLHRSVSVGALHSALRRMEKKGYLTSSRGEGSTERGGRPKLYFHITTYGMKALEHNKDVRFELWNAIPKPIINY